MTTNQTFTERLKKYKRDPEFLVERLILDINEQICAFMANHGITRSELADRLGVSRAQVTKVLNGNPNLTLFSLVKIASALNTELNVEFSAVAEMHTGTWETFVGPTTAISRKSEKDIENDLPAAA